MPLHILDLLNSGCSQQILDEDARPVWVPSPPLPFFGLRQRLADAWDVFMYRATAVSFKSRFVPPEAVQKEDQ